MALLGRRCKFDNVDPKRKGEGSYYLEDKSGRPKSPIHDMPSGDATRVFPPTPPAQPKAGGDKKIVERLGILLIIKERTRKRRGKEKAKKHTKRRSRAIQQTLTLDD